MTKPGRAERVRSLLLDRGGLVALVALLLYLWIAPPYIVDGDNAEFSTLGAIGGTAHPSGYPLYLMWLRLWSWLPLGSPAHTAALATAVLGASAILVLHAACRAWGARPLAATVAVAIFAGAPIAVRLGSRAEVFALNGLVVAAVLWLAANGGPLRGVWRGVALGIVAGLGISNHMTCVLVAPVGILGVVRAAREARLPKAATMGLAVGAVALGMLPYVYLLVTPDTPLSWGTVRSLDDLYGMITRRDYGGAGAFMPGGVDVPATTQLAALALTLGRTWLWAPLVLGLVTLVRRVIVAGEGETRWAWGLFAVSWLVAGPLVASRFNIAPAGLGLYVVQRFHVLPAMLLAVPVAVGLTSLGPHVARIPIRLRERAANGIAATIGFLAVAGLSLPHLLRVHTPAVEQYARNVLHSLPQDAVLFAGEDNEYFGVNYLQWALGDRQDVILVSWQLSGLPWYAHRITARHIYAPEGTAPAIVRAVEYQQSIGHRVFVESVGKSYAITELTKAFPSYPYGTEIELLPHGAKIPGVDEVVATNKAIYDKFELGYPRPGTDDEFATAIHQRYAATWKTLARKLAAEGKNEQAEWAIGVARELGPQAD